MPRLTKQEWEIIRTEWENNPDVTMSGLAKQYNVDVSAISQKAKLERWLRHGHIININQAAQRRADSKYDKDMQYQRIRPNETVPASRAHSEILRTEVLSKHRLELEDLEKFRQSALLAMMKAYESGNKTDWYLARVASETATNNVRALEIKQEMERKAWGLTVEHEENIVISNPRGQLGENEDDNHNNSNDVTNSECHLDDATTIKMV